MNSRSTLWARPEELLFFLVLGFGIALNIVPGTALSPAALWRNAQASPLVPFGAMGMTFAAALIAVLAWFAAGRGLGAIIARSVRDFLPFCFMPLIYETVHSVGPVLHGKVYDGVLLKFDYIVTNTYLFVTVPLTLLGTELVRSLTYYFAFCYGAIFVVYWGMAFLFYFCFPRRVFRSYVLAVFITSVMGYIGYLFVPAIGPYEAFVRPATITFGNYANFGTFSEISRFADHIRELHVDKLPASDCFPSLHTAWTVLVLGFAFAHARWLLPLVLPWAVGTIVGAIYLQQHYLIDILAGVAVAVVGTFVAARFVADEMGPSPGSGPVVRVVRRPVAY